MPDRAKPSAAETWSGRARSRSRLLMGLGAALVVLTGCLPRTHEPNNPFIGPYGVNQTAPFAFHPMPIEAGPTATPAASHLAQREPAAE